MEWILDCGNYGYFWHLWKIYDALAGILAGTETFQNDWETTAKLFGGVVIYTT